MFFFLSTLILLLSALFCCVKCEDDKHLITVVYRFVFANEALCGDPFADPDWLPAANDCFVNCDPTIYMCMIHMATSVQKCKFFSKECQSAIRKHLGWSSSIVSVYRPMRVSSSDRHYSDNTVIDNVFRGGNKDTITHKADRLAVEAAEKIERDLMGLSNIASSPVDHK
uniref:ShKT domain-containing protein n=1 Tax=Angiostrongylus cantonensis TaxID=6313 RepID=A0A0K0DRP4_ANGCA